MRMDCTDEEKVAHERREMNYIEDYPERMEYHTNRFLKYLDQRCDQYLEARKKVTKTVRNREEALAYQAYVRQAFKDCVGPLPSCPEGLMEVTGTIDKGDYLIDKVRIESVPGVFIPANFYYPKDIQSSCPAVLFPCGHASEGKAAKMYVSFGVEGAKNGFCVLIYDPIGQGERKIRGSDGEWLDAVGAHCHVDRQLSTLNEHLAPYMIAESCRALDYILSREEVDSTRIAVTGNSGGGMMSAYMGAYDDRIHVIAPSCYITEMRALLQRIMAQDAEQCTPGFMAKGLDLCDLMTAAAPKPYFVGGALYDFFPIEGLRNSLVESKRMYRLLGAEDTIHTYIAPKGHGMWVDIRMEVLKFLCHHFNMPFIGNAGVDYSDFPSEEVLKGSGEYGDIQKYIYSRAQYLLESRSTHASNDRERGRREKLLEILKIRPIEEGIGLPRLMERHDEDRTGLAYTKSSLLIETDAGMVIECKLLEKSEANNQLCVIVGSIEDIQPSAFLTYPSFSSILIVQPRGIGSGAMHPRSAFNIFNVETSSCYYARLLGESLQGMRVTDVTAAIQLIRQQPQYESVTITIVGKEEHALTALYAAIMLDIPHVNLEGLLDTFLNFSLESNHNWGHVIFTAGLGLNVDVQDLLKELVQGDIRIRSVLNYNKELVQRSELHH